ncbi:UNVERIFIED_CONTAM: hypothetical protein GTU68_057662 [Idotea baltica]|nr:hypothetical protein [Idotea baltica]
MVVGLGTGSTANYFIEALAKRHQAGLSCTTVSSSLVSDMKAKSLGLPQLSIAHINHLDVYVDGADEVTEDQLLLKGRGSDLVKEKLLARASDQFFVLVDHSKLVDKIGQNYPIPVEVMPFAWQLVLSSLQEMGGQGQLRTTPSGDGLAVTSHGSLVLDMAFEYDDARTINQALNETPGVVEHGIFADLATEIFVADDNVDVIEQRR